ncbi:MAG TPA: SDR family oxidoreductase [Polyangiaceae bacterium]|jgi:3-oxoacyl-[acyl-carrier protein] reductase|nr:SDR family oxidoreductase [Polyangiaceae bacterium]
MRTAIITGASRGIGFSTARAFADKGWRIINLSRSKLAQFDAHNILVDLASPGWESGCRDQLLDVLGHCERICLVHNAGRAEGGSVFDATPEALQATLQINLLTPFRLSQVVRPALTPGSSILFVGSTLAEKAVAGYSPYIVSKHALVGLMRSTCQDLIGTGIHTACVCPGFVDTPMLRERCDEAWLTKIRRQIAQGRLLDPDEIARLLLFCAENPAVNGSVLHANLGQVER